MTLTTGLLFWKNREEELGKVFTEIASVADILIGNEEDFQLALGLEGPEAGGKDLAAKVESFKEMIGRAKKAFPPIHPFSPIPCGRSLVSTATSGGRFWRWATSGMWWNRVPLPCLTGSEAATLLSAGCFTPF